ncbi:MAG TPA: RsmE family RNA methyltransferase [Candidatus Acidoferrales bacterium]|nr:RsmE family RNA methyltransferase [Candidatus Acidoferrales bacterium]
MRRRFLVESFAGGSAVVRGAEAHHLGRVLRARRGQLYELSDGQEVWLGRVAAVARDAVEFVLVEPVAAVEWPFETAVLLSIIRFARFEWCLEKATEMGAAIIQPVAAARSERALVAASARRLARWGKIAREAAEQSRRVRAPLVAAPLAAADAFRQSAAESKVLLSERPGAPPLAALASARSVALAFGPEGGWTEQELAAARAAGFAEASLGPLVLRTETAVIAAMALVLLGQRV